MIYTIGYGNKSINNLKRAIKDLKIDILVDIRMRPYSRFNPQMKKKLRIPAYPDSGSEIIRTAFRQHPDTCQTRKILQ